MFSAFAGACSYQAVLELRKPAATPIAAKRVDASQAQRVGVCDVIGCSRSATTTIGRSYGGSGVDRPEYYYCTEHANSVSQDPFLGIGSIEPKSDFRTIFSYKPKQQLEGVLESLEGLKQADPQPRIWRVRTPAGEERVRIVGVSEKSFTDAVTAIHADFNPGDRVFAEGRLTDGVLQADSVDRGVTRRDIGTIVFGLGVGALCGLFACYGFITGIRDSLHERRVPRAWK